jgi:hypothetical protein
VSGYQCAICESDKPVVLLMTSLVTGQTVGSCQDDLPIMMIGALARELGLDAQRLYDSIQRFADREYKSAAKAAQAAPSAGDGQADTDDPPDRTDDVHGDAVDDQGGLSETLHISAGSEEA